MRTLRPLRVTSMAFRTRMTAFTSYRPRGRPTKGSKGITIPVDLRRKTRTTARLRVEFRLRKAITMNSQNGAFRTRRVVRIWTFPTCAGTR